MSKNKVLSILMGLIFIAIFLISNLSEKNSQSLPSFYLLIIAYAIIYLLISAILLKLNKFEVLNCSVLFLIFYTFFIGIGPIILKVKNYNYFFNPYTTILISLTMFLIGNLTFIFYKKRGFSIQKKYTYEIDSHKQKNIALGLLACSIFFWIYFISQNYRILINDMENGRVIAMQGNGKTVYFIYLSMIATWILYYNYLQYNNLKTIYIILIVCFVSFMLFTIGFRSRIAELFLVMLILNNYKKKINIKNIFLFGFIGIVSIVFLYYIRIYVSGLQSKSFLSLIDNVLVVGNINLNYIFRAFPKNVEFQNGYTYLINFLMLKPGPDLDFTLWLKQVLNLSFDGAGLTPTIIGEFYINFGYLGICIGMYFIGVLCKVIDESTKSIDNSIISSIIIVYVCRAVTGGITNNLLLVVWLLLAYIFSRSFYSEKVMQ